jgi:ABC-type sugar transport system substrate-binding protein
VRTITGLVLALALALAACGGDDSGSSGSSTTSGGTGSSSSGEGSSQAVTQAKAKVAEFESGTAEFPAPTEPFNPGKAKAMSIACGFQSPVCTRISQEAVTALKAMGWTPSAPQDGKFSPQTQAGLVEQAVQGGYKGIIMYGIDVNGIKAAVERAAAAGVAIACIVCSSGAMRGKTVIDTTPSFEVQGEMMGWYLIARSGGKAKVVSFADKAFPQTGQRTTGVEKVISANCPDCKFEAKQQSVGETAKPGPPTFTALLAQKPPGTITDVVALYDGIALPMATTLKSGGRSDLLIQSYDADKPVISALGDGSLPIGATVATAATYAAWAAADEVGRKIAGKPLWDATDLPSLLITKNNAAKYKGGEFFQPQGDWQGAFKKLWGTG